MNEALNEVPGPWIPMLKYFRFRGDIPEIMFFCMDFRVRIPRNIDFQVTITQPFSKKYSAHFQVWLPKN